MNLPTYLSLSVTKKYDSLLIGMCHQSGLNPPTHLSLSVTKDSGSVLIAVCHSPACSWVRSTPSCGSCSAVKMSMAGMWSAVSWHLFLHFLLSFFLFFLSLFLLLLLLSLCVSSLLHLGMFSWLCACMTQEVDWALKPVTPLPQPTSCLLWSCVSWFVALMFMQFPSLSVLRCVRVAECCCSGVQVSGVWLPGHVCKGEGHHQRWRPVFLCGQYGHCQRHLF